MGLQAGEVPDTQRLTDESAIRQILALHCRGVDRADVDALTACYWPEATVLYGAEPALAHPFCVGLAQAITGFVQTQHQIGNVLIDFAPDGVAAGVETYVTAYHLQNTADGGQSEMTYIGRYLDRFEKRGPQWKIIERVPVMGWSQNAAGSHDEDHPALAALTRAGRWPDDAVYG